MKKEKMQKIRWNKEILVTMGLYFTECCNQVPFDTDEVGTAKM